MAAATLLLSMPPVALWNVNATALEELAMLSMQLTFLCGVPRLAQVLGLYSIIYLHSVRKVRGPLVANQYRDNAV
jgi:hypothetical protein